jgi:hypothetical protein
VLLAGIGIVIVQVRLHLFAHFVIKSSSTCGGIRKMNEILTDDVK